MPCMEVLGSTPAYANPWLTVREDAVRRSDGSTGTYAVVEAADIAMVVPHDGERFLLVEQYRHPVAGRRWEFPSGSTDRPGEDATQLAARELKEETGLSADHLTQLGVLDVLPSTLAQRCSVFLASGLREGTPDRETSERDMQAAWFTRDEIERMIVEGHLTDSRSTAAYALLLLHERTTRARSLPRS